MPQHILLYTDEPGIGGVAQYNHAVLLELVRQGYQVTCVQSQTDNPLIQQQQALGVQHEWLPFDTTQDFERVLTNSQDALAIFSRTKPDLIFFSDGCPVSNLAAKQAAVHLDIPYLVVVGFAAPYLAEDFNFCLNTLAQQYEQARAVIAVSQENLYLLHTRFNLPQHQGRVIHSGRPPAYFLPQQQEQCDRLRQSLDIPPEAIVCFTAARLEPIKGYQYQLEAIARLQATPAWANLYFVWAGEGILRTEITTALAAMGATDRVRLLGQRWDLVDWYNIADIFVFPSEQEGMPLAVMEAMAKGIPVIASAVSGIPEELGNTGKLLPDPKTDPDGAIATLAATLQQWVVDANLRQAIGQAGKRRAERLFTEARMVEETLSVVAHALLPKGDYVSPGLAIVRPDAAFPHLIIGNPDSSPWSYLRREVPHNWYVDRRQQLVGFLNRDEAHILYNTALKFPGKRALEIGCWLGWSACHLALAGVDLDVVDPMLGRSEFYQSVSDSLTAAAVRDRVNLITGYSPQSVTALAAQQQRQWSLIFIDGDHDAPAPLQDAIVCEQLAAPDAMILFHDLASPDVAEGLDYLRRQGWNTLVYQTMQIMGVAWRGEVEPVQHQPDPTVSWQLPEHLYHYPVSKIYTQTNSDSVRSDWVGSEQVQAQGDLRKLVDLPVQLNPVSSKDLDMSEIQGEEFQTLLTAVKPYTLLSEERLFSLYSLAKQICCNDIPGNFVECGTCEGGSAALLATVIQRYSRRLRKLYAFDTFEGMPEPTQVDRHEGIPANLTGFGVGTLKAPIAQYLNVVCQNLGVTEIVVPVPGLFAQTLPQYKSTIADIAFLHADGDWYESTLDIFNTLYDNVVAGGFIQIDDYGHWEGCKQAVHEFEQSCNLAFLLHPIDYTGVWFRKADFAPASPDASQSRIYEEFLSRILRLRHQNLIIFPDWSQPEDQLFSMLVDVLETVITHPNRQQITLLIDTTNVAPTDADLAISSVVMHLLTEEEIDVGEDDPAISLITELSPSQWQALLPLVSARIPLEIENQQAIALRGIDRLPLFTL